MTHLVQRIIIIKNTKVLQLIPHNFTLYELEFVNLILIHFILIFLLYDFFKN